MKPFLQGRPVQSSSNLKSVCTEGSSAINKAKASKGGAGVTVETVKQGEKVVKLIVTCSCGEKIEIDCLYAPGT